MLSNVDNQIRLPLEIDDIDRSWLESALKTYDPDLVLNDCRIVEIINGTCTKIRIQLDIAEQNRTPKIPQGIVLKGGFEPHSREMFLTIEKEVHAYRDLLADFPLRTPNCYFAANDAERQQGIVIIDDLVDRGVAFCHAQKPQTPEQVIARLTALAKFHAASWNRPELSSGESWSWAKHILEESCVYMAAHLKPQVWDRFILSPRGAAASTRFHHSEWMKRSLEKLVILGKDLPLCVLHGDTHLGNLYIDIDGEPGFFDPGALYGPSMVEVTYHIACALDPVDRRLHERALIQHYLNELASQGVSGPAFDEAMNQYAAFLALGYCIFIINDSSFQPEAINTAYTARFSAAMIDNNTLDILQSVE